MIAFSDPSPAPHVHTPARRWQWPWPVSTFEKAIAANSVIIIFATIAGWWVTQSNPETYHYLIDTTFITLTAMSGLVINFLLLRAAFAPLHDLLATIRAVEHGDLEARVRARATDSDVLMIASAFNAMLDRLAQTRDSTAARVLRAQEDERQRLALELHDQTGQSLTALSLHAEAIAQCLARETTPAAIQARHQAERLAGLGQQTLVEVQALARQLRPPMLDDLGLGSALRWLAEDASERLGIAVRIRTRGVDAPQTSKREAERSLADVETALYRIAQESLTNAVRHGHARQVVIGLCQTPAQVVLTIADDGCGFSVDTLDPATVEQRRVGGLGLEGMRERTRLLGGTLAVRSNPGRGSAIRAVLPYHCLEVTR